jgi:hypothetical protein
VSGSLKGFLFDVEKWFGSVSAQRMSFAQKGVYLVMLFQQWRDPLKSLPNDPQAIADLIAVNDTQVAEVLAAWEAVRRKFVTDRRKGGDTRIFNVSLEKVRRKQTKYLKTQKINGKKGGEAKAAKYGQPQNLSSSTAVGSPSDQLPKSTDLIRLDLSRSDQSRSDQKKQTSNGSSKRPIYESDRFVVFEWQLDELARMLGPHTHQFDLHGFFDDLTQRSRRDGLVIPKTLVWDWLQAQMLAEARRRGLPMASADLSLGKQSTRLLDAVAQLEDKR